MAYLKEFPRFPALPDADVLICQGYADHSWRDDVCPSFVSPGELTRIWVNHPDADKREHGTDRYTVDRFLVPIDAAMCAEHTQCVYSGDDFRRAWEASMCAELEEFCKREGLECRSADDMLADGDDLTEEQREWLQAFSERWEAWERDGVKEPATFPDTLLLAAKFSEFLREDLGDETMAEVIKRNKAREPSICHSHDFCDANMVMSAAWEDLAGYEPDVGDDRTARVWNRAWEAAIATEFNSNV